MGACSGKASSPVDITEELRVIMRKYRLEEPHVQMFYNKFTKFDKDRSGTIDVEEFQRLFDCRETIFTEHLWDLVEQKDATELTFGEFVEVVTIYSLMGEDHKVDFAYQSFPHIPGGGIPPADFSRILDVIHQEHPQFNSRKIRNSLASLDPQRQNKDKPIDRETFKGLCMHGDKNAALLWPLNQLQLHLWEGTLGMQAWARQRAKISEKSPEVLQGIEKLSSNLNRANREARQRAKSTPGSARTPKDRSNANKENNDTKDSKDAKSSDVPVKGALKAGVGKAILLNRLGAKAGSLHNNALDDKKDSKLGDARLSVGDRKDSSSRSGHIDSARGSIGDGKSLSPPAITSTSPPSETETFSPLSPAARLNDDGTTTGGIRRDSSKLKGTSTNPSNGVPRKYLSSASSDEKDGSSAALSDRERSLAATNASNTPTGASTQSATAAGGTSARRNSVALDVPVSGGKRRASIGATSTIAPAPVSSSSSSSPIPASSMISPTSIISRKPGMLPRHQSSLAAPDSNRTAGAAGVRFEGPFSDRQLLPGRNTAAVTEHAPTGIQSDRVFSKKSSMAVGGQPSSLATTSSTAIHPTNNTNSTAWTSNGRTTPPVDGSQPVPVSAWPSRSSPPTAPSSSASSAAAAYMGNRLTEEQRIALERGEDIPMHHTGATTIAINRTASISRTGELSQTSIVDAALSHRIADYPDHESPGLRGGVIASTLPGEIGHHGHGHGSGSGNGIPYVPSSGRRGTGGGDSGSTSDRARQSARTIPSSSSRAPSSPHHNTNTNTTNNPASERDREDVSYRGRQSSRERKSVIPDSAVIKPHNLYRPQSIDFSNRSPTSAMNKSSVISISSASTTPADVTRHLTDRANGNSQRSYRDRQRSDRAINTNTGAGPTTDDRTRDHDRTGRDRERTNDRGDRDRRDDSRDRRDDRERDRRDHKDRDYDRDRTRDKRRDDDRSERKKDRRNSYHRYDDDRHDDRDTRDRRDRDKERDNDRGGDDRRRRDTHYLASPPMGSSSSSHDRSALDRKRSVAGGGAPTMTRQPTSSTTHVQSGATEFLARLASTKVGAR